MAAGDTLLNGTPRRATPARTRSLRSIEPGPELPNLTQGQSETLRTILRPGAGRKPAEEGPGGNAGVGAGGADRLLDPRGGRRGLRRQPVGTRLGFALLPDPGVVRASGVVVHRRRIEDLRRRGGVDLSPSLLSALGCAPRRRPSAASSLSEPDSGSWTTRPGASSEPMTGTQLPAIRVTGSTLEIHACGQCDPRATSERRRAGERHEMRPWARTPLAGRRRHG